MKKIKLYTLLFIITVIALNLLFSNAFAQSYKKYVGTYARWVEYGNKKFGIGITWTFGYKVTFFADTTYRLVCFSSQSKLASLFANTEGATLLEGKCIIKNEKIYLQNNTSIEYSCVLDDDELEFYINGKEFDEKLINIKDLRGFTREEFIKKFENGFKNDGVKYEISITFLDNNTYSYSYWDSKTNKKTTSKGKWELLKSGSVNILDGEIRGFYIDMDYDNNIYFFDRTKQNPYLFYLED